MQPRNFQPVDDCVSAEASTAVRLRPSEWLVAAYFTYAVILAVVSGRPFAAFPLLAVGPLLGALAWADARSRAPLWSVVRDWLPTGLVLFAYLSMQQLEGVRPPLAWEDGLLSLDRALLDGFHLRAFIESLGTVVPSFLELAYSLLYAVPLVAVGALYLTGRQARIDRFHRTFLLGTLLAYALLPHFPLPSPREAFPGADLPTVSTIFRRFNLWLLDGWDIRTSVFPSGHVAVAFSAAFGMWRALPEKRWIATALFAHATFVFLATFYSRYHYAADGLASIAIAAAAFLLSSRWRGRDDSPDPSPGPTPDSYESLRR